VWDSFLVTRQKGRALEPADLRPAQGDASLSNWFREFRRYHRDDKGSGKLGKRDDHLMDATRYLIVSGRLQMQLPPEPEPPPRFEYYRGPDAWMQ
jgi:hypothetical protein